MKPYGHTRKDLLSCVYGCCARKSGFLLNCRKIVDRANRKSARQEGVQEIKEVLKESPV